MDESSQSRRSGRLIGGLILMTLGAIFLLGRLDLLHEHSLGTYWPCILIAIGVGKLLLPGERDHRGGGLWLIFIGLWAQASILHWFGLSFQNSWPLFLIFAGVRVIARELLPGQKADRAG